MTKKGIVFIIIIVSVISILTVAVWGTLPESTSDVTIESLEFLEFDDYDEDLEKVVEVNDIVTIDNPSYTLKYDFSPNDAYGEIKISVSQRSITFQHDPFLKEIYLFYTLEDIEKEVTVTVTITDKKSERKDTITLWFSIPDIIEIPD